MGSEILLGYVDCRSIVAKKIGDKSCQSNFDTQASDIGSFLVTVFPHIVAAATILF